MSNQQHVNARLPWHAGPYFPEELNELRKVLDAGGCTDRLLKKAALQVPEYRSTLLFPRTTDRYVWFIGFAFGQGIFDRVVILIPHFLDWKRADSTRADRSLAVYGRFVQERTYQETVGRFTAAVKRLIREDETVA